MFERELRDLSHVHRWSIARLIKPQNVAEHSFYVTHYAVQICQLLGIGDENFYAAVMHYALWHDVDECFTGDIIGPVKRSVQDKDKFDLYKAKGMAERFNYVPDPSDDIKSIIKCADLLDEVLYLSGEMQMGNNSVGSFRENALHRLWRAWNNLPWKDNSTERERLWELEVASRIKVEQMGHSITPRNDEDLAS